MRAEAGLFDSSEAVVSVGHWPPGIRACMSTRRGGQGQGPYASFNVGLHVGDDATVVQAHRAAFEQALGGRAAWLNQVHGARVADAAEVLHPGPGAHGVVPPADACVSTQPGLAAVVLVADCLPVLLARADGKAVAAAHAGWRGLAAGVLESTVAALRAAAPSAGDALPSNDGASTTAVVAWLGPCIGPRQFEVGDDVREAFGAAAHTRLVRHRRADGSQAWLCDLPGLASDRLQAAGVQAVDGGLWCTVEQSSAFFSYRRDGRTGRMAAGICLRGD